MADLVYLNALAGASGRDDAAVIVEPTVYFARTIRVDDGCMDDFIDLSRSVMLPVWERMRDEGSVESIDTIRLGRVLHEDDGIPRWDAVQVGRVRDGGDAGKFFERERELLPARSGAARMAAISTVMRTETLRTTPRSHHPEPRADLVARRGDVRLSVEVIAVSPTPAALEEYQRLMTINAGPATGKLCAEGILFSFVPLETDRVLTVAPGMPAWNQLHMMATFPDQLDGFIGHFDAALREANPASGGYDGYFGALDGLRHRPRWTLGRWVDGLSVWS